MTQELQSARSHRLEALDVLRAFAAVAVVLIHTSAAVLLHVPVGSRGFQLTGLVNQASRFAVPAFVLITGAALFHNYGNRAAFSAPQYYRRRLKSLGLPYLFWSTAYFLYTLWVEQNYANLVPRYLTALASAGAIYTFYYFQIIVPLYVLFPLVRPLAHSRWLGPVTAAALAGNGLIVWFGFPHVKFELGPFWSEVYPHLGNSPFWWMGPFFLGAWLVLRRDLLIPWLRRFWTGLAGLAGGLFLWVMQEFLAYARIGKLAYVSTHFRPSAYWYGIAAMLAIIGAGVRLTERGGWPKAAVLSFSQYSFAIYLVHPLVMFAAEKLLRLLDLGTVAYFALQVLLVLAGSYAVARAIDAIPGAGRVIGTR